MTNILKMTHYIYSNRCLWCAEDSVLQRSWWWGNWIPYFHDRDSVWIVLEIHSWEENVRSYQSQVLQHSEVWWLPPPRWVQPCKSCHFGAPGHNWCWGVLIWGPFNNKKLLLKLFRMHKVVSILEQYMYMILKFSFHISRCKVTYDLYVFNCI
jgi:hypothetical protein